jgi:L-ascorbate metabolism protein UlaG (beta-lactamase superfamily)
MNITHIRNATQLITYAGKRLLIDPMLAPQGAYPGFPARPMPNAVTRRSNSPLTSTRCWTPTR